MLHAASHTHERAVGLKGHAARCVCVVFVPFWSLHAWSLSENLEEMGTGFRRGHSVVSYSILCVLLINTGCSFLIL